MSFLIVLVLLLVVMYVLMIRPQKQRQQAQQSMLEGAGVGDDVLTNGGIYGTITHAEGDDLVVEIADGLEVHMTRRGIAAVLPPEEDEEDDAAATVVGEDEVVEGEVVEGDDEAPVARSEEVVTSEGDADAAASRRR